MEKLPKSALKLEKERRGLSSGQIALAVGVSQATISRIENGKARSSPELADKIARYFENTITRDQILFPEDYVKAGGRKTVATRQLQKAS